MKNVSKLDREMWGHFFADPDAFLTMAAGVVEHLGSPSARYHDAPGLREGSDYEVVSKARRNQDYFRDMVLSSYNNRCCITGIEVPELLVASHIIPWAKEKRFRLDPQNGLCLNALHDKAFDRGLITVDEGYCVVISSKLRKRGYSVFNSYEGKRITLPGKFRPSQEFLSEHRDTYRALYR